MSQDDVRRLLLELDGEATIYELADLARKEYPDRTLHTYLSERLQPMEKKGIVERVDGEGRIVWRLTEKGKSSQVGPIQVENIDRIVSENDLEEEEIELSNLVGSLRLERELDLLTLSADLNNTDYHPETYPSMIYRVSNLNSVSVLTPSSGRLAIVGAKSKEELLEGTQQFIDELKDLGIEVDKTTEEINSQNIVATTELGIELDLQVVAVSLGLENVEYEPEQFPGLIYRSSGNATVLIFASGKCVITGAKTYDEVVDAKKETISKLEDIGVEF
jgi:transcription initiation factor TFIID TATA-box-binding protein